MNPLWPRLPDVKGTWTKYKALNKPVVFYAIGAEDQVTLTSVPTDYTEGNLNYNYVIPQPLTDVSLVGDDYAVPIFRLTAKSTTPPVARNCGLTAIHLHTCSCPKPIVAA